MKRVLATFVVGMFVSACGGSSSPTTPSTSGNRAAVSVTALSATGTKTSTGYSYAVWLTVQNTGAVAATLTNVAFSISAGGSPIGSVTLTDAFAATSLAAGASQDSRAITLTDDIAGHAAASTLTAVLTYTDAVGSNTASRTADVPAIKTTFTLSGTVTETVPTTSTRLSGARIEILDGSFAGRFTNSATDGTFSIPDLSGQMNVRTTRTGYEGDTRGFDMSQDRTATIALRPTPGTLSQTYTGTISGGDTTTCSDGVFTKPCKTVTLSIHNAGLVDARLDWVGGSADLDLTMWNGSTLIAYSRGVNSSEHVSANVSAGNSIQLRITYYGGSNVVNYELRVTRPN